MNDSSISYTFNGNMLSQRNYFSSLVFFARRQGIISESDFSRMQSDMLSLLARQTALFTHGKSSSVPIEKARDISESIAFAVGIALKSYPSPYEAAVVLCSVPPAKLFEKGQRIIHRKLSAARLMQSRLAHGLLQTPNVFYRATVIDGINGFFKLYDPQFSAHEIHITADYPTCAGRPDLNGIEFIEQYISFMTAENSFCILFDPRRIHRLMCGISRDYTEIPINIFEPIFLSAAALAALNRNPSGLDLSHADIGNLSEILSTDEIPAFLKKSVEKLDNIFTFTELSKCYIDQCIPELSSKIKIAARLNTLNRLFITPS